MKKKRNVKEEAGGTEESVSENIKDRSILIDSDSPNRVTGGV